MDPRAERQQLLEEKKRLLDRLSLYYDGVTDQDSPNTNTFMHKSNYQIQEEKRKRARTVFKSFKTLKKKKGGLLPKDLQELADTFGVTLDESEANSIITEHSTNAVNGLDLQSFTKLLANNEEGPISDPLARLSFFINSKAYSRTVKHFQKNLETATKPDLSTKTFVAKGKAKAGDFGPAASALSVHYTNDPATAKASREDVKTTPTSIVISVSFTLKPDVDEFELGELAGTIGDLLLLGKKDFRFHSHKCQLVTERGEKVMRFSIFYDDDPKLEKIAKPFLRGFELKRVEGRAECSQRPIDLPLKDGEEEEFIMARGEGVIEIGARTVEFLNDHIFDDKPYSQRSRWNVISALSGVDVDIDFGNMEKPYERFAKALESETPLFKGVRGLRSLKQLIMPLASELYNDGSIPAPIKDAYFSAIGFLRGIHTIKVQLDDQVLTVEGESVDIFSLLPTRNELNNWVPPPAPAIAPLYPQNPLFQDPQYKIVVMGNPGVGKSASVVQFVQGVFVEQYDPTIEDSYRKMVEYEGESCLLDIFDTCSYTFSYGDGPIMVSEGFIIIYSITDRDSFNEATELYNRIKRVKADKKNVPIILVGNKSDLGEKDRKVSRREGEDLAAQWNVPFIESSAKITSSVQDTFFCLLREMLKARGLLKTEDEEEPTNWFLTPPSS